MPVPSFDFKSIENDEIQNESSPLRLQDQLIWPLTSQLTPKKLEIQPFTDFAYPGIKDLGKDEPNRIFDIPEYNFETINQNLEESVKEVNVNISQAQNYLRGLKEEGIRVEIKSEKKEKVGLEVMDNFSILHGVKQKAEAKVDVKLEEASFKSVKEEEDKSEDREFSKIEAKVRREFEFGENYNFNYVDRKPKHMGVQTDAPKASGKVPYSPKSKF